jgi:hypothetical protein
MKKLLIVSLMMLAVTANASTQWTPIANARGNSGQPVIGVDYTRSFTSDGMFVVFWNDFTMGDLRPQKRPNNRVMSIYRTKIDCKNRMVLNQFSQQSEVKHFHDPRPEYYESPWSGKGEWYVPDIGSAHEFVMNHFCGFKNP